MTNKSRRPVDWQVRARALDPGCSFIVQAPAGSGKTELLIQRILTLLALAKQPEDILAITFTRKAAGEMRTRLLDALRFASDDNCPEDDHARTTWELAHKVLESDRRHGWGLLVNPNRLQLMTIDSLCAALTRRMPWLARFGTQPETTDRPDELYMEAAERLLEQVERSGPGSRAARRLLRHVDNRLNALRDMLVDMLRRRDQWLRHLLNRTGSDARTILEESLQTYIASRLEVAYHSVEPLLRDELWELCRFAAENLAAEGHDELAAPILSQPTFPGPSVADWPAWQSLLEMLLTGQGKLRRSVNRKQGFLPGDGKNALMKQQMLDLLAAVAENPRQLKALDALRHLPHAHYPEIQWVVLEALVDLLPLAVVELQQVFREKGQVDFVEVAGAARAALGSIDAPEDLLLQLDSRLQHILVDEFQDTSHGQYALLEQLTAGWCPGDGRTLFLVGDPMQSIYRFREAEVGLYLKTRRTGLRDLPLEPLTLQVNFRSQAGIVDWVNDTFKELFPAEPDEVSGAVPYAPAIANKTSEPFDAVSLKLFDQRQDHSEAEAVVAAVKLLQRENPQGTTAILVRSRNHLLEIVKLFKDEGLRYQAQEIDLLNDRPVVQDLRALTRALLHLDDRVSWLTILRAPWCGLALDDLLRICAASPTATVWELLTEPGSQGDLFQTETCDSRQRIDRLCQVMGRALSIKGRITLHRVVESAWLALGGAASVDETGLLDARQVFRLLSRLEEGGDLPRLEVFDEQLKKLFAAPDAKAGPELQIMTIHKAKGLEFDTVVLPGLGRPPRAGQKALLRWQELPDEHLMLAPVPAFDGKGEDRSYSAIGRLMRDKDALETLRLFYVAATRAKNRLLLLGHAKIRTDGTLSVERGSLLEAAWPVLQLQGDELLQDEEAVAEESRPEQGYGRLPADWSMCPLPAPVCPEPTAPRSASSASRKEGGAGLQLSLKTEEGRAVGTLTHFWLERIVRDGLSNWSLDKVDTLVMSTSSRLAVLGVPGSRLPICTEKILSGLRKSLQSDKGRWLLGNHPVSDVELSVSGVVERELVHATIDRTFVCENDLRWIVDYKTSAPSTQPLEEFIRKEIERYHGQMALYAKLFKALEPDNEVRVALYFPMMDHWHDLTEEINNLAGECEEGRD